MLPHSTKKEDVVLSATGAEVYHETVFTWTQKDEKLLVRKIDFRIFPVMVILFILNFIDRNNFANARLKGLEDDLHLTNVQYQTCISILLVGYVGMQVPSNMFLNSISHPSLYLCCCATIWGMISACTAATHSATGAILCRFFLGAVEAALFPGTLLYLSRWYTRSEMQLRVTLLNAGNLLAQAFGSLIAAGVLSGMEGVGGIKGWRWLFIIEGVLTIASAIILQPVLPDYPSTTRWLSQKERLIAQKRLVNDVGIADDDEETLAFSGLKMACNDPIVWVLGVTYFLTIMGLSFSLFFPTITEALGFDTTTTLLLNAPPWIWALCVSLPNAWHADRTGERYFHYLWPAVACMVGYLISGTVHSVGPRYFACFLMTTGYASGFVILAWISNTIYRPTSKRAAAIGIINAMGNIGSIPGSYIWTTEWGPYYSNSFWIVFAILGSGCILAFGLRQYLIWLNRKLDQKERAIIGISEAGLKNTTALNSSSRFTEETAKPMERFRYLY